MGDSGARRSVQAGSRKHRHFTTRTLLFFLLLAALLAPGILATQPVDAATPSSQAPTPGSVWSWGYNQFGQLGDGTRTDNATPAPVGDLTGVLALAGGDYFTLALKSDGSVAAWGYNEDGELGTTTAQTCGSVPCSTDPVAVPIYGVTAIAGGGYHSLALKSDGTVWSWGWNGSGQLGTGTSCDYYPNECFTSHATPLPVQNLSGVVAIAAGTMHSLVLKADGSVWAWGDNYYGQVGAIPCVGCAVLSSPTPLWAFSGATAIAAGDDHSLALRSDGTVWTWGLNVYGQLGVSTPRTCGGTGTTQLACSRTPIQVPGLTNVVAIAGGFGHSMALKSDGTVWTWGLNNQGQLGTASSQTCVVDNVPYPCSTTPQQVPNLTNVVAIAAGGDHNLALKSDGSVWAWGADAVGQLGDGTSITSGCACDPAPVEVTLSGAEAISAGGAHSLAVVAPATGGGPGGGTATPELSSGELLATGLLPISLAILFRRRRGASRRW